MNKEYMIARNCFENALAWVKGSTNLEPRELLGACLLELALACIEATGDFDQGLARLRDMVSQIEESKEKIEARIAKPTLH